ESSGLGGRCILTLAKRNRDRSLPWTRLGVGTPVLLTEEGGTATGCRGVVCERDERFLRVAVNEPPESAQDHPTYRLDLSSDEAARLRQRAALERARSAGRERLAELRQVLLGETPPQFEAEPEVTWLDPTLNDSQKEAVRFALS